LIKICGEAGYTNLEFYRMHENPSKYKLDKKRLRIMKPPLTRRFFTQKG